MGLVERLRMHGTIFSLGCALLASLLAFTVRENSLGPRYGWDENFVCSSVDWGTRWLRSATVSCDSRRLCQNGMKMSHTRLYNGFSKWKFALENSSRYHWV